MEYHTLYRHYNDEGEKAFKKKRAEERKKRRQQGYAQAVKRLAENQCSMLIG